LNLRVLTPGLRAQVLLLALILLAIPWVGYRYVLEMERFLREGQESALGATARAVSTALHDRPALFAATGSAPLGSSDSGLYVRALPGPIELDGFDADWPAPTDAADTPIYAGATVSLVPRLGKRDRYLYLLAKVSDEHLIYRANAKARPDRADRIELAVVDPHGNFVRFVIAPLAAGSAQALRVTGDSASWDNPVTEPRVEAFWRETRHGYVAELRMPLTMIGPRLGLLAASVDDPERRETTSMVGPTGTDSPGMLAPVVIPESEIDLALQELGRTTTRIWVVDREHRVLAQTGTLKPSAEPSPAGQPDASMWSRLWFWLEQATLRRIYAQVFRRPSNDFDEGTQDPSALIGAQVDEALAGSSTTRWRATADQRAVVLSAAHPIKVGSIVAGAVVVEETTNAILSVRTRALETLFTTALVVLTLGTLTLFVFATRLSTRIRRLRDQAEEAVDAQGRMRGGIAASAAHDEIGDLSRSLSTMVRRLGEYNDYLESMGGRLAHEIRTPITVVRSSLDNLSMQVLPDDAKRYMDRAREGLARLSRIVASMTEATRLEQTLQHAEQEKFDLVAVVSGCVNGYRLAYSHSEFELNTPGDSVMVSGAPELIAQMLDKLAANAVDFAHAATLIVVSLEVDKARALLSVSNRGPALPAHMQKHLFESMVSIRPGAPGTEPHLGMGLYIVRLIAQFHGGAVRAENCADGSGVVITIELPIMLQR
jgi:two-component system, OmpR family, sensor histidine kinase ChvG